MIARAWHGRTARADADVHGDLYRAVVLPHPDRVEGHAGAGLPRRDDGGEVESVSITRCASMGAVRAFAGPDHHLAVSPGARRLLSRPDRRCGHDAGAISRAGVPRDPPPRDAEAAPAEPRARSGAEQP